MGIAAYPALPRFDPRFGVELRLPVRTARRFLGVFEVHLGQSALTQAIATAEGAPSVTNNPGDLELGDIGYGTFKAAGGQQITIFPTYEAGLAALENQISLIVTGQSKAGYTPDMTIAQVGQIYAGGGSAWAQNVANALGLSINDSFAVAAGLSSPTPAAPDATPSAVSTDLDTEAGDLGMDSTTLLALAAATVVALVLWW